MSVLIVPEVLPDESRQFPTLGDDVIDWIEDNLVYGPGVLKGEPYKVAPWVAALIRRAYQVYPQDHPLAGTRRFKLVSWSLKKGSAKTELGAILTIAEAHPEAPVRCDGFDAEGRPVGVGVTQPFIPMFAFNLEQSEELGFSVARSIIEESSPEVQRVFDTGIERIMVLDEGGRERGKIVPVGNSPAARDGARTTFALIDETHHLTQNRHKRAVNISRQNLFKRAGIYGSGWQLETTTAFSPGEGSVAEDTYEYAKSIAAGDVEDSSLFYFHRQASDTAPLDTRDEVREALLEAAGPTADWSADIEGLVSHWFEPNVDRNWYRRVWLNQPWVGSGRAFDVRAWRELEDSSKFAEDDALVVLGFDGSRRRDATALIAVDVEQAHFITLGIWRRPDLADDDWEMPAEDIDETVQMAFDRWDVWRMYGDPPGWSEWLDAWAGRFGDKRVVSWWTNRQRAMAHALANFDTAMRSGMFTHDGDEVLATHVANAIRKDLTIRGDDERPLWGIRKARPDSVDKIDGAVAATLAWEAYGDCVAAGMPRTKRRSRRLVTF